MPYLALLLALSGVAGSFAPGPRTERILWSPEAFIRATPVGAFHGEALRAAHALLGAPYHFGGSGPGRCPTGEHPACADCSGLLCVAFAAAGVTLPHSSAGLAALGQPVAQADIQPGDILVFRSDGNANGEVNHSGIYVGNGLFLHAGSRGVRLDELDGRYWGDARRPRLRAIRRITR
ncbi:MAG: C40 family peptidase [Armatimonadetes bacterium]|nr:C40 family peptidase [Armatimonadota bacterium]